MQVVELAHVGVLRAEEDALGAREELRGGHGGRVRVEVGVRVPYHDGGIGAQGHRRGTLHCSRTSSRRVHGLRAHAQRVAEALLAGVEEVLARRVQGRRAAHRPRPVADLRGEHEPGCGVDDVVVRRAARAHDHRRASDTLGVERRDPPGLVGDDLARVARGRQKAQIVGDPRIAALRAHPPAQHVRAPPRSRLR